MQPFIHATVQPCNRSIVQSLAWQFSRMAVQWYKASVVQSSSRLVQLFSCSATVQLRSQKVVGHWSRATILPIALTAGLLATIAVP